MTQRASVRLEDGMAVICIPIAEVHGLRVALNPIRAGETVCRATEDIRSRLDKALARLQARERW